MERDGGESGGRLAVMPRGGRARLGDGMAATSPSATVSTVGDSHGAHTRNARGPQVLFQARSNLFSHPGGDTVVVRRLMATLESLGARVQFTAERGVTAGTDVVHTINFATPETTRAFAEDATRAGAPLVVTTLYEDWPRFAATSLAVARLFAAGADADGRRRTALDPDVLAATLRRVRNVPAAQRAVNDVTAGMARVLVCCSDTERRHVVADHPQARDVRVIPFGADLHTAEPPLPDGTFAAAYEIRDYVLCVARLEARKNQLMVLEALRDDPRPVVLVTGGFSYQPEYARLCARFERRGRTLLLERLPSVMMAAAFRDAAVHCLPSWYELPGLVSLEAALHGTRVAASGWGAIEDYLGDTIAYLEPDDPESIRRAVNAARALDPTRATARAREFTWARTAQAMLTLYEELAPAAGASAPAAVIPHTLTPAAPVGASCGISNGILTTERRSNGTSVTAPAANGTAATLHTTTALDAATRARGAGAWDEALQHAERAAGEGADPAAVAELRAVAFTHLRRLDDAAAQFAALLGSTEYRHRGEAGLGIIALERGDEATARAWLERATAVGGTADAWAALGLCLSRLAQTEEAWRAYVEARSLDPAHRAALSGLITLASPLARLGELETHLRDYLGRVGEDADVRVALAGCLYAAGRTEESRTTVREVLRGTPTHPLARALDHELAS